MNQHSLHNLQHPGRTSRRRLGRGTGSGLGTTAGRGTKGQSARSGGGVRPGFEGGQTPLYRLLPKLRGFKSRFPRAATVNVEMLEKHFASGETVNRAALLAKKLIPNFSHELKVLGEGELTKKLTVTANRVSKQAKSKIEKAGGTVRVMSQKKSQPTKDKKEPAKPAAKP
jgi:large subunit ribosomal protein L15